MHFIMTPTLVSELNILKAHGSLSVIRGNLVNIYRSNIISELFTRGPDTNICCIYSFGGRKKTYKYLLGTFAILETFIMAFISGGKAVL